MSFRMNEKKSGEYTNYEPDFKSMDLNESVNVKVLSIVKEGESQYGKWVLFRLLINGLECSGFASGKKMMNSFIANVGKEVVVRKVMYKDKNNNDKVGFDITTLFSSSPSTISMKMKPKFQFRDADLSDNESKYSDIDAINFLKENGKYDVQKDYESLWVEFGSTAERGAEVFKHRGEL